MRDMEHEEWLDNRKAQKSAKKKNTKPAGKPQAPAEDEKKKDYDDRDLTNPYRRL